MSPSSSYEKKIKNIFRLSPSSHVTESGTPIRRILCLKNADDVARFEETEDCFILDFDPFQPLDLSGILASAAQNDDATDLAIVAETGKWLVEITDIPGTFVRNSPLKQHRMKVIVTCATAMFVIHLPHACPGLSLKQHIVMLPKAIGIPKDIR